MAGTEDLLETVEASLETGDIGLWRLDRARHRWWFGPRARRLALPDHPEGEVSTRELLGRFDPMARRLFAASLRQLLREGRPLDLVLPTRRPGAAPSWLSWHARAQQGERAEAGHRGSSSTGL